MLNGLAASYTAVWATTETWTIYNGFVAYVLMGALMGGEWLVRARLMKTERNRS